MATTPYQRVLAARKRARILGTKRKGKPLTYKRRAKKGRTGGKRRADSMRKYNAPVSRGTKVTRGGRGPGGVGYSMSQVSDTCTRITGRAYIGEVSTKGKVPSTGGNAIGLMFDINPALLNDRVAVIASTFEKYVYHGVKFTYIPQCSTATTGSVAMVFDRDPLQYAACVNNGQFLAELMSYEHAVLTPAYVGASTSFTRDPKELKTWFVSSPDATLSTRETSQGNFLAYVSNGAAATNYGFIVMDYVLDLVAPNLLPNKQDVSNVRSAPSQWRDFNGGVNGMTVFAPRAEPRFPIGSITTIVASGLWDINGVWGGAVGDAYLRTGTVGEFVYGGLDWDGTATTNALIAAPTTTSGLFDGNKQKITLKHGQKIYFCAHVVNTSTGADVAVLSFHTTLSSARAAQSLAYTDNGGGNTTLSLARTVIPDMIYCEPETTFWNVGGWMRLITDGTSAVTNNA